MRLIPSTFPYFQPLRDGGLDNRVMDGVFGVIDCMVPHCMIAVLVAVSIVAFNGNLCTWY